MNVVCCSRDWRALRANNSQFTPSYWLLLATVAQRHERVVSILAIYHCRTGSNPVECISPIGVAVISQTFSAPIYLRTTSPTTEELSDIIIMQM